MKKKKVLMRMLTIYGVMFIFLGITLISNKELISTLSKSNLNLSITEIDTEYGEDNHQENLTTLAYHDNSWTWPTDIGYSITSNYSWYHPALDIVCNNHTVYSANSGTVITNSYKYDNGNYLVIKQDEGHYIMYAHLSQKLVSTGQRVEKGQIIGVMGSTGFATGVHLHFAVWEGYPHQSKSINPFSFY